MKLDQTEIWENVKKCSHPRSSPSINFFPCINYYHAWLGAHWRDEKSFKVFFLRLISSLVSISSQPVSSISSIFIVCSSLLHSLKYGIKVVRAGQALQTNADPIQSLMLVEAGGFNFFALGKSLFPSLKLSRHLILSCNG